MNNARAHQYRRLLRHLARLLERLLLRTQVTGREHLPSQGAAIFVANHASTLDPLLMISHLPAQVYPVGPGDFKLLFPGNLVVEYLGVILIQRGAADRDSLKRMAQVLKEGHMLALFPEGGTWEKRLDDVKPGAAYISMTTGAPIIPIAIGGTYQVWEKLIRLQRPRISFTILPPLSPPVEGDRRQRTEALQAASLSMMQRIYDHLPATEQARYDLHAHQRFSACVDVLPDPDPSLYEGSDFAILAELVSKPNLFSPLHRNLKLPLRPFVQAGRFVPAAQLVEAVSALQETLYGTHAGFIPYRLGERKAKLLHAELATLYQIGINAAAQGRFIRFVPQVAILEEAVPPND